MSLRFGPGRSFASYLHFLDLENNFGIVPTRKTKKGKTSKFVDAGGFNRNEREGN